MAELLGLRLAASSERDDEVADLLSDLVEARSPLEDAPGVDVHVVGSVDAVSELLAKDAIKDYASMPLEPTSCWGVTRPWAHRAGGIRQGYPDISR